MIMQLSFERVAKPETYFKTHLNLDLPADLFLLEFPLFLGDPDQSRKISD